MGFEPQKFFIGVIDFFSILLPGAALTYLFKANHLQILPAGYPLGVEGWAVFLFSSYLLGHFLFFIGSWLDDLAYDPLRKMTKKGQITRLLDGRSLSPMVPRMLAWLCFKNDADAALDRVVPIKERYLKRIEAPGAVNAFQWCKARLALETSEALATVSRFEADSKFFRSVVPVTLIVLGWALYCRHGEWLTTGAFLDVRDKRLYWRLIWVVTGSILAMGLAFVRYMEQRFKSTQQAYWYILTLEASKDASSPAIEQLSSSSLEKSPVLLTHAGGVVFRQRHSGREYLLVQAKTDPNVWVLPKGHIEANEDPRRCAIREVKEETGVWARIKKELKTSNYEVGGQPVWVQFYLMEAVGKGTQEDRLRKHEWLPYEVALRRATHPESQDLLKFAEETPEVEATTTRAVHSS